MRVITKRSYAYTVGNFIARVVRNLQFREGDGAKFEVVIIDGCMRIRHDDGRLFTRYTPRGHDAEKRLALAKEYSEQVLKEMGVLRV